MIQILLLAAGYSHRFGSDKLMHKLDNGKLVIEQSITNLRQVSADIKVIIRPQQTRLHEWLQQKQMDICLCPEAENGMGSSISCGVNASLKANGWLIVLADMPFIQSNSINMIYHCLEQGTSICVPVYQGQQGHPVGFQQQHRNALLQLKGDRGARSLFQHHSPSIIEVDDPGILQDIDTPDDLILANI